MKTKLLINIMLASIAALVVAGCSVHVKTPSESVVVAPGEVDVSEAPPVAAEVDVETPSPGPDYVWIGGAWAWGGSRWAWEKGHWDRPPHPGAVWVAHRYENRSGRHVFVRGGWK